MLSETRRSAARLTRWPAALRAARRAHPPQPGGDARDAWRRRGACPSAATAAAATAAPRGRAAPAARSASPAPVHALARDMAARALRRRASRAAGAAPAACQPRVCVAAAALVLAAHSAEERTYCLGRSSHVASALQSVGGKCSLARMVKCCRRIAHVPSVRHLTADSAQCISCCGQTGWALATAHLEGSSAAAEEAEAEEPRFSNSSVKAYICERWAGAAAAAPWAALLDARSGPGRARRRAGPVLTCSVPTPVSLSLQCML